MLLVRTHVGPSPIHGLGLFADERIAPGQAIWRFEPLIDRVLTLADLARMPAHLAEYLEVYCEYFPETGELVLSGDNDRFTNHSDDPNTAVILPNGTRAGVVALRDIAPGEEITCDYGVVRCLAHAAPVAA